MLSARWTCSFHCRCSRDSSRDSCGEIGEIALERGALEQLPAPLQRLAHLALGLGEPLERFFGLLGIEILQRPLQRGQALAQLGRERAVELLADLLELALPGGIAHPRRLGALPQRLQRLLQLLGLLEQLLLSLGHGLRPLRALERERLLVPLAGLAAAGALAGQVLGLPLQPPASLRDRVELAPHVFRSDPLRRPDLAHRGQPEHELPRAAALPLRRVVRGDGVVADGVARQKIAPVEIERMGENGAVGTLRRHREGIADGRVHRTEAADAPAHHGDGGDPVVVPYVHHQRHPETQRRERVGPGHGDLDGGDAVGDDADREPDRIAGERRAVRAGEGQAVLTRRRGDEAAGEHAAAHLQRLLLTARLPHGRGQRRGGFASGLEPGAGGQQQRVAVGRHRLGLEIEILRVVGRHGESAQKDGQPNLDQERVGAAAAAGHARVHVAGQRAARDSGVAEAVETHAARMPLFARRPQPEHRGAPADRLDAERHRIAPVHHALLDAELHRRHQCAPCAGGMPQRGRRAGHRTGRHERHRTDRKHGADPRARPRGPAARSARPRRRRGALPRWPARHRPARAALRWCRAPTGRAARSACRAAILPGLPAVAPGCRARATRPTHPRATPPHRAPPRRRSTPPGPTAARRSIRA